jgi:hypothetical protein
MSIWIENYFSENLDYPVKPDNDREESKVKPSLILHLF